MATRSLIRLFVTDKLTSGERVTIDAGQSHYLRNVMRHGPGDEILLFNGADGEWRSQIVTISKKSCSIEVLELTQIQISSPDLWLCFAPIKKSSLEFLIQKATELGIYEFWPTLTTHADVTRINADRCRSIAIEAAEQCGRLDVPVVRSLTPLDSLLDNWPQGRILMFCDEAGDAAPAIDVLQQSEDSGSPDPWAILIGPVGGFSSEERRRIRAHPGAVPVSLGPRILRADTAALVASALWQAVLGDSAAKGRGER